MKRVITEYVRRDGDEYVKITTIADYTALDGMRDAVRAFRTRRAITAEQRRVVLQDLRRAMHNSREWE